MTKKSAAAALPAFKPDAFYDVTLSRVTAWKGKPLSPAHALQLRGDVCEELKADIANAVEV